MDSTGDDVDEDLLSEDSSTESGSSFARGIEHESRLSDTVVANLNNHEQQRAPDVGKEDSDFTSEEDIRENRFDGKSSTWHFHTEAERGLAASLDQERASDLSVHLYNAHALKARVCDPNVAFDKRSRRSKKQWIKLNEDGSVPWHPDAIWTAWPLPSEDVPRPQEQFGVPCTSSQEDAATYRKAESWKAGTGLEDEIKALLLRTAKTQLRDDQPPGQSEALELELLVDEDEMDEALQPTVRDVLSKFDDLLSALHKARQARSRSRSRSHSRRRSSRSVSTANDEHSSEGDHDYRSRRSSDAESETEQKEDSQATEIEETVDDGLISMPHHRNRILNPRDWSAVLGATSLSGWNQDVVDRAASRCASLFGEGMTTDLIADNKEEGPPIEVPSPKRYYCPVESCQRRQKPFPKAWRMRAHLKRTHKYPQGDIEGLERERDADDK